jgi:hypothetical protein
MIPKRKPLITARRKLGFSVTQISRELHEYCASRREREIGFRISSPAPNAVVALRRSIFVDSGKFRELDSILAN